MNMTSTVLEIMVEHFPTKIDVCFGSDKMSKQKFMVQNVLLMSDKNHFGWTICLNIFF